MAEEEAEASEDEAEREKEAEASEEKAEASEEKAGASEEEAEATEEEADQEKQEVPEVLAVAAHQVVVVSDGEEAEDGLLPRPRVPLPEPLAAYLQPVTPAARPGPPRPSKRYRLSSPQPQR